MISNYKDRDVLLKGKENANKIDNVIQSKAKNLDNIHFMLSRFFVRSPQQLVFLPLVV